jgi:hypothetical protein
MQNKQMAGHRPRPDTRDDLDSREKLEQTNKGEHVTHNRKDIRNNQQKKKKDR